jgi:hypothetical protein
MWLTTERNQERPMLDSLLTPVEVGALALRYRIAMAPMTRDRSGADGTPTSLNAAYYGGDEHGYTDYPMLSTATTKTER